MRSNVTVGPPFDLLLYKKDSLEITRYRRVSAGDRDLNLIHSSWEQSLRRAVEQLPDIEFQSLTGNENPRTKAPEKSRDPEASTSSIGFAAVFSIPRIGFPDHQFAVDALFWRG